MASRLEGISTYVQYVGIYVVTVTEAEFIIYIPEHSSSRSWWA